MKMGERAHCGESRYQHNKTAPGVGMTRGNSIGEPLNHHDSARGGSREQAGFLKVFPSLTATRTSPAFRRQPSWESSILQLEIFLTISAVAGTA